MLDRWQLWIVGLPCIGEPVIVSTGSCHLAYTRAILWQHQSFHEERVGGAVHSNERRCKAGDLPYVRSESDRVTFHRAGSGWCENIVKAF